MAKRLADGERREQVRRILEEDPYGNLSDFDIAESLSISEAAVQRHRSSLRIPSAQLRRRKHPDARSVHCVCGRGYLLRSHEHTRQCRCGQKLYLPPWRK